MPRDHHPANIQDFHREVTGYIPNTQIHEEYTVFFPSLNSLAYNSHLTVHFPAAKIDEKESRPSYKSYQPIAIKHIQILNSRKPTL